MEDWRTNNGTEKKVTENKIWDKSSFQDSVKSDTVTLKKYFKAWQSVDV